ncbi:hypothetical protein GZH49_05960 [Nocardia terpenica]|uniref:hypothetical protein n=1 Tax=Nocardia terpenica TaxID=455432 RepID=UPI002FE13897
MSDVGHWETRGELIGGLQRFESTLLYRMNTAGLPADGVLVDIDQRQRMLANLAFALDRLGESDRARSHYISKMVAAVAAGLFDAALNYLWDETIAELRRRVALYDLSYFFDVAMPAPEKRKYLRNVDDLSQIQDVDLLRAARDIGLLSDIGHSQLDSIRYMRNHASAAHPNQNQLTGLQLATWLETCIREVITLPVDNITADTGALLSNLKQARLSDEKIATTASFFGKLPPDRADVLAAGFFGLYTSRDSTPETLDNIRTLWPHLWPYISDQARYDFGTRIARFAANADHAPATRARQLFDLVDAAAFLPELMRTAEIDTALESLLAAHHGWNNFATEPAPARQLEQLIGERGQVPTGLATKYVKTLVEVFLTNGHGVCWAADQIYIKLIERLNSIQAQIALRSFTDQTISSRLQTEIARSKWTELLALLEPKLTNRVDRDLYTAIRNFTDSADKLRNSPEIMLLADPPRVLPKPDHDLN